MLIGQPGLFAPLDPKCRNRTHVIKTTETADGELSTLIDFSKGPTVFTRKPKQNPRNRA
jgi:hypothetical protein